MKAVYSDRAKQDPQYPRLVYATSVLADALGGPTSPALKSLADGAEVHWDVSDDTEDGPRYHVRLKNWMGSAHADLEPDEVNYVHHLRFRMVQLCSTILRDYSHELAGY